MLPLYLHNNVFSAPNWTFVHGFLCFGTKLCRKSRCFGFGDTFRPLKKLLVTQKGFCAGLPVWQNSRAAKEPALVPGYMVH